MAASFTVLSQSREVQVLGPTQVLDVERVGFVTHPTGIYVETPVPLVDWLAQGAEPWLGPLADTIEGLIADTAAVDGSFVQDVDAAGLLIDYVEFVVEYVPPGSLGLPQTTTVRIPLGALSAATDPFFGTLAASPDTLINNAYAALAATAGL